MAVTLKDAGSIQMVEEIARRQGAKVHRTFPKPEKRCKHRWTRPKRTPAGPVKYCRECGTPKAVKEPKPIQRTAAVKRYWKAPLSSFSKKQRRRIKGWPALRAAIVERDGGICGWCEGRHPNNTADHAMPKGSGGADSEVNLNAIGQPKGYFGGCHEEKSKAGVVGDVKMLLVSCRKYGVQVPPAWPGMPPKLARTLIYQLLEKHHAEILAGRKPSLLEAPQAP